jgi:PTH2 family peptidyl-tRNA hydrolase
MTTEINKLQQVLVIRKDLNMRKGKMVAQACHASLKATIENQSDDRVQEWLSGAFTKICVSVNSEEELKIVYEKAQRANMVCALIEDSGLTEFHGVPTLTCCAVGPATKEDLQDVTGDLKLL